LRVGFWRAGWGALESAPAGRIARPTSSRSGSKMVGLFHDRPLHALMEATSNLGVTADAAGGAAHTARPHRASGNDPFPAVLRSGDRTGPADASRSGILSIPPLQTPACRLGTIDARPSPNESPSPRSAPPARMYRLSPDTRLHAYAVDDDGFPSAPNPVLCAGHFNRTLPGRFSWAPKCHASVPSSTACSSSRSCPLRASSRMSK